MPPAFVLSQDQTLKFVRLTYRTRSKLRRSDKPEYQGADTCTVKRNGYEWTCIITSHLWRQQGCGIGLRFNQYRTLEVLELDAVAHMSLHQKLTMSKSHQHVKADSEGFPDLKPGDRLSVCVGDRSLRSRLKPSSPRRWRSSRRGLRFGQRLFVFLFQKGSKPAENRHFSGALTWSKWGGGPGFQEGIKD